MIEQLNGQEGWCMKCDACLVNRKRGPRLTGTPERLPSDGESIQKRALEWG